MKEMVVVASYANHKENYNYITLWVEVETTPTTPMSV